MSDRTVCVIDDDAAVLKGVSRLLKAWGPLRRRAIADGALCVLEKPFDDVELRRAVEDAFLLRASV